MKNKVRQLRKQLGLTQSELAAKANVGRSTISTIETGKYTPRVDVAILVAHALDRTVEEVFILSERR